MPRSSASIRYGRSPAGGMIRSTEPTAWARSMVWMWSNSSATSPSFSERTTAHERVELRLPRGPLVVLRPGQARLGLHDACVLRGAVVDLTREHHRGRRCAADDGRVRALHGGDLDALVQRLREHDERTAVVPRDDTEHDRTVEVRDRPPDLGAVLELQPAHRLGRAVEARQVGEHDERSVAAGGVDRARGLLGRDGEQRPRRPMLRPVGGRRARGG